MSIVGDIIDANIVGMEQSESIITYTCLVDRLTAF